VIREPKQKFNSMKHAPHFPVAGSKSGILRASMENIFKI
jgi:hypothetical protein